MNKKKYISVGFFVSIILIGAGIAYYFDSASINNVLGITPAQVDGISGDDLSAIDDTSSSVQDISPQEPPVSVPVTAKKTASGEKSAQRVVSSSENIISAANQAVTPTTTQLSDNDDENFSDAASTSLPASTCSFPLATPTTTRQVIVNEVAWMGSVSSSVAEWMELKNNSTGTILLSGWKLMNATGKILISFSDDDTIAPVGLLLLSRENAVAASGTGITPAAKIYSGDLVNGGDVLVLMDAQCDVSDYLDASHGWPAGNNLTKATMERDANDNGWHTSALPGGTPGAENSAGPAPAQIAPAIVATTTVPVPVIIPVSTTSPSVGSSSATGDSATDISSSSASAATTSIPISPPATSTLAAPPSDGSTHILIAAVQIAGAASDNDLVKLYNPTDAAVDMSGWKLHKKSATGTDYSLKSFPAGSVIAAGESFVWANSENGFSETVDADVSSTETLSADNSVALLDSAGNVIDAVAWGTGTGQYGEGPPYPTSPGANQMLSRRSSGGAMMDTDNNTNDFDLQ